MDPPLKVGLMKEDLYLEDPIIIDKEVFTCRTLWSSLSASLLLYIKELLYCCVLGFMGDIVSTRESLWNYGGLEACSSSYTTGSCEFFELYVFVLIRLLVVLR
jgi:hypothetical protein